MNGINRTLKSHRQRKLNFSVAAVFLCLLSALVARAQTGPEPGTIHVVASDFTMGATNLICDGTAGEFSFTQSAVKQDTTAAKFGPAAAIPYFTVRFAMPIPPENETNNFARLTGIDSNVFTHNHSPGFEILPNGDALAVYFSTPPGQSESATTTTFVQTRLRYGSEEWDMPELFFDFKDLNDQSGLLWRDGNKVWFFGGGRGTPPMMPFKMATSTDDGATWTLSLPQLDEPAEGYTPQPITSAFRDGQSIFFAMDGNKSQSFLWRSDDDGIHWQQTAGRTGGRHSAIVPLDDKGDLLSLGGKDASVDGWSPENFSTNRGASWSKSIASPFPPLGSGQRPAMIRLTDGNLCFVSDAYLNKAQRPPPDSWHFGDGAFVAISTNNGTSWRVKTLPVQLPNHGRGTQGTLGYVTVRQGPNGVIHILTTETEPCLHYEMNEAWIFSDAGDIQPENSGGVVKVFSENYPDGKTRSKWSARICPNGRYLLDGKEIDFYANGAKEHEVAYKNGRKTGAESFWAPDGKRLWEWQHNLKKDRSVWTQYWPNGNKRFQSTWNTKPEARDLKRSFFGYVAEGPASQWNEDGSMEVSGTFSNGLLVSEVTH
ncbi:MAG TPA: exo-alpha-sialidase [Verrucomicrobiae bacterium]